MKNGKPSKEVLFRSKLFHTDAVICGLSALGVKANAPTVLRNEALNDYPGP
jgi:2-methylcitrate dehydratase